MIFNLFILILKYSAYIGSEKIVNILLKKGAIRSMRDNDGRTPLHLSTGNFHIKCINKISKKISKVELNESDCDGYTPLHWAVLHNRIAHVKLIISKPGINLRATDIEGKTALHLSTSHIPDTVDAKSKILLNPHSFWCSGILLKEDPAIINLTDYEGRTSLHLACLENNIAY